MATIAWVQELRRKYSSSVAHTFILSGNVRYPNRSYGKHIRTLARLTLGGRI